MSKVVDERVVVLNFDNKKFEKNTRQTMKTLKSLKKEMKFDEVSDSINEAYDNTDPSKVIKGIEKVNKKFTAMEIATITAINRITNKALDSVERLAKSLSIDNVISGWRAYEEEVKSVGTLLGQGYEDSVVNKQLELLSKYSEATSYNYSDMANNIGKFTAAGVKLDDATQAIMGIANWAALSGQNAQKASMAMYQLAQAIGAGTVKLQDWKSIQNVNMDTQEFRKHVLDTAVAMGKLKKNADGTYKTLSGKAFDIKQFTTQLSEGWFTSDVLVETLKDYSAAVEDIFKLQDDFGGSAAAAVKEYEKLIADRKKEAKDLGDVTDETTKQIEKMEHALKAFKSAQEARTFTDAINATKDAVTSGWRDTFKAIFGEYEEAKQTWTQLADDLWNIFAAGGQERNKLLKAWGGKNLVANAKEATNLLTDLQKTIGGTGTAVSKEQWLAFNEAVGGTDELKKKIIETAKEAGTLYEVEEGVWRAVDGTTVSMENFDEAVESGFINLKTLEGIQEDIVNNPLNGRQDLFGMTEEKYIDEQGRELTRIAYDQSGALVNLMKVITALRNTVSKAWNDTFGVTAEKLKSLTERIRDFSRRLSSLVNEEGYFTKLYNIMRGIFSIGKIVVKMFKGMKIALKPLISIFTRGASSAINIIEGLALKITEFADTTTIFEDIGKQVAVYTQKVADVLHAVFSTVAKWVSSAWPTIENILRTLWNIIKWIADLLVIIVGHIYNFVKSTIVAIKESELFQKVIQKVSEAIHKMTDVLKSAFDRFKEWVKTINASKFAETIKNGCKKIGDAIYNMFSKMKSAKEDQNDSDGTLSFFDKLKEKLQVLRPLVVGLKNLWTGVKNLFGPLIRLIGATLTALGDFLTGVGERIDGFLHGRNGLINLGELVKTIMKVGIATILTSWVTNIIRSITKIIDTFSIFLQGMKGHSILERTTAAIKNFAISMLMFTGAILILSKLDTNQVSKALAAITAILAVYVGFIMSIKNLFATTTSTLGGFSIFKKGEGLFSSKGGSTRTGPAETIKAIGILLLSMSASMLIISIAVKSLSTIKEDETNKAITVLVLVMGMLSVFLQQLKAFVGQGKMSMAKPGLMTFIGIAILIKSMAKTMVELGTLEESQIIRGSVVVMALSTALSIVLKALAKLSGSVHKNKSILASGSKSTTKSGSLFAMVGVLISLTVLFGRISKIMGEMSGKSWEEIGPSLAVMGLIAGMLTVVLLAISRLDKNDAKNAKKMIGVLMSLTLVFAAMAGIMYMLTENMTPDQFNKAIITLSIIFSFITLLVVVMKAFDLLGKDKTVNVDKKKESLFKMQGIFSALLGFAAVILAVTLMLSVVLKQIQNGKQLAAAIVIMTSVVAIIGILIAGAVLITKQDNDAHIGADRFNKLNKIINSIAVLLLAVTACIYLISKSLNESSNPVNVLVSIVTVLSTLSLLFIGVRLLVNKTKTMSEQKITRLQMLFSSIRNLMIAMAIVMVAMTAMSYGKDLLTSVLSLLGGMVVMIGSIWLITKIAKNLDVTKVNSISLLLIAIAGAIRIMAVVTSMLKDIDWESVGKLAILAVVLAGFLAVAGLIGSAFGAGLLMVAGAVVLLAAGVWLLVDALDKLISIVERLQTIEIDPNVIGEKLSKIAQGLQNAGSAIGNAIGAIIGGIIDSLWTRISGFVEKLLTYVEGIGFRLGKILAEVLGGALQGLAETNALGSLGDMLLDLLKVIIKRLPELVNDLLTSISALIDVLIQKIPEIVAKLVVLAFTIVISFLNALADELIKNADTLIGAIQKLCNAILTTVMKLFGIHSPSTVFKGIGGNIVSGLINGISDIWSKVKEVFTNLKNNITSFVTEKIINPFKIYGKNIMDGLFGGLREGWNKVTGFFNDLGNNIKTGWEKFWGIRSPSRVFKQFGNYMTEGLAIGLEDDKGVIKAVKDLGNTVTDEFNKSDLDAVMMAQLNNLNLEDDDLVIRPVMDLTNVQNGAAQIADIMRSFNNYSINGMSDMASGVATHMSNDKDGVNKRGNTVTTTNNNNDTQYITINVSGTNAKEIADEVSREIQKRVNRRNKAWE